MKGLRALWSVNGRPVAEDTLHVGNARNVTLAVPPDVARASRPGDFARVDLAVVDLDAGEAERAGRGVITVTRKRPLLGADAG